MKTDFALLLRLYSYFRTRWLHAGLAFSAVFVLLAVSLVQPQVIRRMVDHGIVDGDLSWLAISAAKLLGLALIKGVVVFVQGRSVEIASQGTAYDLRKELHERLTTLSFSFHDRSQAGQLLSRAMQDVERIRFMTGKVSLRLVEGASLLFATVIVLALMNPLLALLVAPVLPLLTWRAFRFGSLVRPLGAEIQDRLADLTSLLEQNLRGARIVKAFAQEDAAIRRFAAGSRSLFELSSRMGRIQAVHANILSVITDLSVALVVGCGGWLVIRRSLSLGELVAFTAYMTQLAQPVRLMGAVAPVLGLGIASGKRLVDIFDAQGEVEEAPGAIVLPRLEGRITFDKVDFGYAGKPDMFRQLGLDILPGEIVAFTGMTGSGKSTLMNLIPRFYDVCSGSIQVDGNDIRNATLSSLRSQIGIVLQESTLFAVSVRENISFGTPDADETAILDASKAACAHDFITSLPAGYDTVVGERGATLSGGQRQRIAIARALLKNPRILLLDDATSSVDAETETLIQKALERLMQGRTCIVIAHRASTLRMADRVIVLDRGRKAAEGKHEELLAGSRLYAEIFRRQFEAGEVNG